MLGKNNYVHQLDDKQRMRLPAKFRESLGNDYYLTVGIDHCICVYAAENMKAKLDALASIDEYDAEKMKAARYVTSNTIHVEEDKQGRFFLPDNLKNFAGIDKNVVVYTGPQCIEIWAEENLNDYFNDVDLGTLKGVYSRAKQNKDG